MATGGNNRINFQVGFNVDKAGLNQISQAFQKIQNIKPSNFKGTKEQLEGIKREALKVEQALNKAFNTKINSVNFTQFKSQLQQSNLSIDSIYNSFSKLGATGQAAFSGISRSVLTSNLQLKQTSSFIQNIGTTLMNTVKWTVASTAIRSFTSSISQAFTYVKSLDSSLNDIRIVTKDSADQMANFAIQANKAASELGRSTLDYTKAALTFYQQGLDDQAVQARTQAVLKAQNITGAGSQMADYLTAVWNGYKVANKEAELYVDKLAAVADSSASNMSQIAIAMSKVSSAANILGVDVDSLAAQIATIVATTRQAPQSVGNALKTVYARINDISTGADDAEVSLGNYSKAMLKVGISVLDANGRLRNTGDVIDEVGEKWGSLSREQQIFLARTMAGQRQYNKLITLFDNWSKYTDLVTVSMQSQGATEQKNAIYMESLAAHTERLGTAQQRLKSSMVNSQSFKGLIDTGTALTTIFAHLIQSIGGGGNALLILGGTLTSLFSGVISREINNVITNLQSVKYNAELVAKDIQSTALLGASKGYSSGVIIEMVDAKKAIADIYSQLSSEQINQYNQAVNTLGISKQQVLVLKQQTTQAENFSNNLQKVAQQSGNSLDDQFVLVNNELEILKESLKELKGQKAINLFNDSDSDYFGKLIDQVEAVRKAVGQNAPEAFKKFDEALAEVCNSANPTQAQLLAVRNAAQNIFNKVNTGTDLALRLDELKISAKDSQLALERAKQKIDQLSASLHQQINITSIVKGVGALGRLAGAINALGNIKNIINDKTLSQGEKLLKILTTAGFALPTLLTSLKGLNATFGVTNVLRSTFATFSPKLRASLQAEAAAFNKKTLEIIKGQIYQELYNKATSNGTIAITQQQIALLKESATKQAQAAMTNKATTAQIGFNAALKANPIGAVITGITMLIAVIAGLKSIFGDFGMSAEQAAEAINTFNQKQKELLDNSKKVSEGTSSLKQIEKEYEELSKKAGAISFDSAIDNLTQAERQRYNQIKNIIAEYNKDAIVGYNDQGQAILQNNIVIEQQIQLLKQKHQLEIDNAYTSNEFKDAQKARKSQYNDAKDNVSAAQRNVEYQTTQADNTFNNNISAYIEYIKQYATDLSQYQDEIDRLEKIQIQGYQNLDQHFNDLDDIQNKIEEKAKQNNDISMRNQISNLSYVKDSVKNIGKEAEQSLNAAKKQLEQVSHFAIEDLLGVLQTTGNNQEYLTLTKTYGTQLINSLIQQYANGLTYENTNNINQAVIKIKQGLLSQISNLSLTEEDIKQIQNNIKEKFANNDIGKMTVEEYKNFINQIVLEILKAEPELLELAKTDPQLLNNIIRNLLGFNPQDLNIDIDFESDQIITKVTDARSKLLSQVQNKIKTTLETKTQELQLQVPIQAKTQLNNWATEQDINTLQNIDRILQKIDWSAKDLKTQFEQTKNQIVLFDQAMSNISTTELLQKKSKGETLDTLQLEQLISGLQQMQAIYPQLQESINIINSEWLESTNIYKKAIQDVVFTTVESIQQLKETSGLSIEESAAQVLPLITNTEILQDAYKKALISTDDYFLSLQQLASQYPTCIAELNNYEMAIRSGDQATIAMASDALLLSTRAAEIGKISGINADQIEKVAEFLSQNNEFLQENAQLAADAAQRYIKLNTAISDLYQNSKNYKELLAEIAQSGMDAVYSNKDLFNSFSKMKGIVADLFDTSVDFLGDDWIVDHMNQILQAAENGGEGLKELQQLASEEILLNIGVDFDGFEEGKEAFLSAIAEMDEGAVIEGDVQLFLQQLVTAMEAAGYAQGEIEKAIGGMGIDVDLAPYEEGLNVAIDEAMQAGKLASDHFAQNAGVNSKIVTQTDTVETQNVVPGQEYDVVDNVATYTYPIINASQGPFGPQISVSEGTQQVNYPSYLPRKATETVPAETNATAVGLQVVGATKSSGGKISHYNSPGARSARSSRANSGKGSKKSPKKSTKKKGSSKKPKEEKTVNKDLGFENKQLTYNPYEKVTKQLERQSDQLEKLQKQEDKLTGKDRLQNLEKQNKTLQKQNQLLRQRQVISDNANKKNTTAWFKKQLKTQTSFKDIIKFDSDGQISNTAALQRNAEKTYNNTVKNAERDYKAVEKEYNNYMEKYNKMSAKQQESSKVQKELQNWKQTLKEAEETAKNAEKSAEEKYKLDVELIKSYTEALEKDNETRQNWLDNLNKITEIKFAKAKIRVDLSLDMGQLERDWIDFEDKFIKPLEKDDFLGQAKSASRNLFSFLDTNELEDQLKTVRNLRLDLITLSRQLDGGQNSKKIRHLLGISVNDWKKMTDDQRQAARQAALAMKKEDLEKYLKTLQGSLVSMQQQTDKIRDTFLSALDQVKSDMDDQIKQFDRINSLIEHGAKLSEMLFGEKAYDNAIRFYDMQKKNNIAEMKRIAEDRSYWESIYQQEVKKDAKDQDKQVMQRALDNLQSFDDQLRNTLETTIEILHSEWEAKMQKTIKEMNDTLTNGKGLDFANEEWDYANKYDDYFLDPVESKMGMEEVQRLYEKAIKSANGDAKAQERIRNLLKQQMEVLQNKDQLTQYDIDRAKKSLEIEQARYDLENARNQKTQLRLRRDSQGNYTYQYVAEEEQVEDLEDKLANLEYNLYEDDKNQYKKNLKQMMSAHEEYTSKIVQLEWALRQAKEKNDKAEIERISNRINLLNEYQEAYQKALNENQGFIKNDYWTQSTAMSLGVNNDNPAEMLQYLQKNLPIVGVAYEDFSRNITAAGGYLQALAPYQEQLSTISQEYAASVKEAMEAAQTSTLTMTADIKKAVAQTGEIVTGYEKIIFATQTEVEQVDKLLDKATAFMNTIRESTEMIKNMYKAYYKLQDLNQLDKDDNKNGTNLISRKQLETESLNTRMQELMREWNTFYQSLFGTTQMASGGYTGAWGEDGKIAVLHEKELVLNADDTSNILSAVQTVRDITSGMSIDNDLQALSNSQSALLGSLLSSTQLDQNVHIEANFPNVTQHTEIEQAFENLVNIASMHASKRIN